MKKILLIIFIFIIFAVNVSAEWLPAIIIRSEEELSEIRKMAEASDEELIDYLLRTGHYWNGMTSREDVVTFLNLLDSLPIPYVVGMRSSGLNYFPYSEHQTFNVFFESETGEWYVIRFWTNEERSDDVVKRMLGEDISLHYTCRDNRIRVYSPPESWNHIPNEYGDFFFPIEIDGYYLLTRYVPPKDVCVSTVVLEDIFLSMTVSSFADEPWRTTLSTSDALLVLRAVAGLAELTDAQIARFGIDGEPTSADAMRILRVVAGL
jgi:hypothetical protein